MKKIEAYIRPDKLDEMKSISDKYGINGMSITQINGFGIQKGWKEFVRGSEADYLFLPKIKIESIVPDEQVEDIVESMLDLLSTGEFGDGKIFLYDVADAYRIRTKEQGESAIR